jgi:hypothetical protein
MEILTDNAGIIGGGVVLGGMSIYLYHKITKKKLPKLLKGR